MSRLLWRASLRYYQHYPWQLVLAILGMALGVAVVVAVELAAESARRAFDLSSASLTGRATHQIVGGPAGLDERLYARLRVELGVRQAAPVVEGYARAGAETLHLIGLDAFAEASVRGHLAGMEGTALRRLLTEPNSVLLAGVTAARLGVQTGTRLSLHIAGRSQEVVLVGTLDRQASAALDGMILADIATAQELSGTPGRLSWIDLVLAEDDAGQALQQRIARLLPADAELLPAARRSQALGQMARAFRVNLSAMSLLALVVGMFLVYQTMNFTVVRRRDLLGQLRALGVTRGEVYALVLGESLLIGMAGVALGLLAGAVLGQGLVRLVARTINDLYYAVTVSELLVTPAPLLKAGALGMLATFVAAWLPAHEAAATTPRAALMRSTLEARAQGAAPRLAGWGVALMPLALVILWLPAGGLLAAFAGLFLLMLGFTLMVPFVLSRCAKLLTPLAGRLLGVPGRLALVGIDGALSRTGLAVAALMLALAATVGVGVMIASFRAAVETWLDATLQAEVYVSLPNPRGSRTPARLDPALVARVKALPVVAQAVSVRRVQIESQAGLDQVVALDAPPAFAQRFKLLAGDPAGALPAFFAGRAVLVSEPYAYRRRVAVGERITLRTDRGMRAFAVAGVYRDYSTDQGEVLMLRALYDAHYRDADISSLGLWLKPGVDPSAALATVRAALAGEGVLVRSTREIRAQSLEIFERTFTITAVLRWLTLGVAGIGMLCALMALALERAREFGILRALGFTPGQVAALVMLQTGFMGLVAGLLAWPTGWVLAQLLIHVINRRAFGWSMDALLPAAVFAQAMALALGCALLASLYPAWKMAPATMSRAE